MNSLLAWFENLGRLSPTVVLVAAVVVFPTLFFVDAPYGRYTRATWGPTMPARWNWVLMESPSVVLFAALWLKNPHRFDPMVIALAVLWLTHYVQRTLVYPFLMRGANRPNAIATLLMALVFNTFNATGNAVALVGRPFDAPFAVGVLVFISGFVLNLHSDAVLRSLRGPNDTGYRIPFGGAYRFVTSPNYLGEVLEWVGFAIAAQTLAGVAFAVFTFANLAPRAARHQRWYREKFADYPKDRRILVPFVW